MEKWKEQKRQKERKLQKLITKRAQANDPHVALAQICESKVKEFRYSVLVNYVFCKCCCIVVGIALKLHWILNYFCDTVIFKMEK